MTECIQSLEAFPDRGWLIARGVRELLAPFGRDGYVLRYRVGPTQVTVTRIFHGKERR